MLGLIAALRDGRKVVLAVESGYRESTESWAALLRDLKARGAAGATAAHCRRGTWGSGGPCEASSRRSASSAAGTIAS